MIDALREWCIRLMVTGIVCSFVIAMTPEGGTKQGVKIACSIASALALISLAGGLDTSEVSKTLAQMKLEARRETEEGYEKGNEETRFIIEEKCEAYILDKEEAQGLTVEVTAKWSDDGYWYPYEVHLSGTAAEKNKSDITYMIESELGIPAERQIWGT